MEQLLQPVVLIPTTIALLALAAAIFTPRISAALDRRRKRHSLYEVIWKRSKDLAADVVLCDRALKNYGYLEYYYERDHDKLIEKKLEAKESFIVVGRPLAGKSRAVYRALRRGKYHVTMPKVEDVDQFDFSIPEKHFEVHKPVLLLNDIQKFFTKRNFEYLFNAFLLKEVTIVATCRLSELPRVKSALESQFTNIFKDPIEIPDLTDANARDVAKGAEQETGELVKIPEAFDHTIGSLFLPLDPMRQRFAALENEPKCFLLAMKRLYAAGVYKGREVFSIDRIKRVCKVQHEIELKKHEWDEVLGKLQKDAFIKKDGDQVTTEESYLQKVIADEFEVLDNLREMLDIFKDDPQACCYIGDRAYDIGENDLEIAQYMHLSIKANNCALKNWTPEENPRDWAGTQNNLGNTSRTLAELENKPCNCRAAIDALEKALKVFTLSEFPMDYAMTQNNLGTAYSTLADVDEVEHNCKKAIEEALRVRTLDKFPMHYAMTQNNLGITLKNLAVVNVSAEDCKKAITAFQEALKVYTLDKFPKDYAMTQNNLGNAYQTPGSRRQSGELQRGDQGIRRGAQSLHAGQVPHTMRRNP
jgi:tetratricopeptide (TPR) repeat protein